MTCRRAASLLIALLTACGTMLAGLPAQAQHARYEFAAFEVPGKVRCEIVLDDDSSSNDVRCDVQGASFTTPPRPDDCYADWGATITLDEYVGARFSCVGDAINSGATIVPGETRTLGEITCTGIVDGVRCVNGSGAGFDVTPTAWSWVRREGKSLLRPTGAGKIRVGMTLAKAKKRGTLRRVRSDCGGPGFTLRKKYGGAYVIWRKKKVDAIVAWSGATLSTTTGVGVGSSLADARQAYPQARLVPAAWPFNAAALVVKKGKTRLWMLFSAEYGESVWDGTRMEVMVSSRRWKPAKKLDYHGCGYGS